MPNPEPENSYQSILKTTGLIGLVQVIGVALGLIRTKMIALLLGSQGFGVLSLYNGLVDFAGSTSLFGANIGGVKELSKAHGENDHEAIRQIIYVLRFWTILSASVAALVVLIFAPQISQFQFAASDYVGHIDGIRLLGFAVIFGNIYQMQISILNGVRKLRQMALAQVLAGVGGVVVALPIIYFAGKSGIEWSILAVALFNSTTSYIILRKQGYRSLSIDFRLFKVYFLRVISVGLSFAVPGVVGVSLAYATRFFLKEHFSFELLGIYQACIVLSTLYVQTILSAMGADFLPRLMAVHTDNNQMNKMVNEQMELGILVASAGVFVTFILAPYMLQIFYSEQFVSGAAILRWQILAVFLRVLEWPLGFATTAKGKNILFMSLQSGYVVFELGVLVACSVLFGIKGLAVSYFIAYTVFFIVRVFSVKRISGFDFSPLLKRIIGRILLFLGAIILLISLLPSILGITLSLIILVVYLVWCNQMLKTNMGIDLLHVFLRKSKRSVE